MPDILPLKKGHQKTNKNKFHFLDLMPDELDKVP